MVTERSHMRLVKLKGLEGSEGLVPHLCVS